MSLVSRMIEYISGKYIKTVSNQTLFGAGNIEGGGGGGFEPTEIQLAAINSGIDEEKVEQIESNTIDIVDRYTKSEVDELLLEKAPLDSYDVINTPDPLQADQCIFNFYKKQENFTRLAQKKLYNAYFPDPVGGGSMWGTIETTQMCRGGGGALYIKQVATRHQGSDAGKLYRFIRKGYVANISNPYTDITNAAIDWGSWKAVDYPNTLISGTSECRYNVKGGTVYIALVGTIPTKGSGDIVSLFTLPVGIRPPMEVHGIIRSPYGGPEATTITIWCGISGVVNGWCRTLCGCVD